MNMFEQELIFRQTDSNDSKLIKELMEKHWGGEPLVIRGEKYYPSSLDGILVLKNQQIIGFLFYEVRNKVCEIIVFEVFDKFKGTGTKMLDQLKEIAKSRDCEKLYLMTTNDSLDALRFYQRRGFYICGIHIDSVKGSRKIKPSISETGDYGIPLRDEIDLEFNL